jgi:hypothetical protein
MQTFETGDAVRVWVNGDQAQARFLRFGQTGYCIVWMYDHEQRVPERTVTHPPNRHRAGVHDYGGTYGVVVESKEWPGVQLPSGHYPLVDLDSGAVDKLRTIYRDGKNAWSVRVPGRKTAVFKDLAAAVKDADR